MQEGKPPPAENTFSKKMTRSRKTTPICGMTKAESEKKDKRSANRLLRRKAKAEINVTGETELTAREVSDIWKFSKDGKHYWPDEKAYRK
jgi:hypothetical protein